MGVRIYSGWEKKSRFRNKYFEIIELFEIQNIYGLERQKYLKIMRKGK